MLTLVFPWHPCNLHLAKWALWDRAWASEVNDSTMSVLWTFIMARLWGASILKTRPVLYIKISLWYDIGNRESQRLALFLCNIIIFLHICNKKGSITCKFTFFHTAPLSYIRTSTEPKTQDGWTLKPFGVHFWWFSHQQMRIYRFKIHITHMTMTPQLF